MTFMGATTDQDSELDLSTNRLVRNGSESLQKMEEVGHDRAHNIPRL